MEISNILEFNSKEVLTEDNVWNKLSNIAVGDFLLYGGRVVSIEKKLVNNIYLHEGLVFCGKRVVFEDNKWIWVKDSKNAKKVELPEESYQPSIIDVQTEKGVLVASNEILYGNIINSKKELQKLNTEEIIALTRLFDEQLELGRTLRKQAGNLKVARCFN